MKTSVAERFKTTRDSICLVYQMSQDKDFMKYIQHGFSYYHDELKSLKDSAQKIIYNRPKGKT